MKKISLIAVWIIICLACNNTPANETKNTNMNDTNVSGNAAEPTPGVGNDPTRNDATKENPLGGQKVADSSNEEGNAGATPGLGNDPTRNDPANSQPGNKKDTAKKN